LTHPLLEGNFHFVSCSTQMGFLFLIQNTDVMERTNNHRNIPDAINHSVSSNFTQVPNRLLRNQKISAKAKTILFLLLSNKKGWKSSVKAMENKFLKEGETAIRSGIKELEEYGYLIRIRYRDKKSKQWEGAFWSYTDTPWQFTGVLKTKEELEKVGLEMMLPENLDVENRDVGNPDVENRVLIIHNNKKSNSKNINTLSDKKKSDGFFGGDTIEEYSIHSDKHWNKHLPIDYESFVDYFNKVSDANSRMTPNKKDDIKKQLKTFTGAEIKKALENRAIILENNEYLGSWDSIFSRKVERMEKYLTASPKKSKSKKPETGYNEPDYEFQKSKTLS